MASELKSLIRKRSCMKGKMTIFDKYLDEFKTIARPTTVQLLDLESRFNKFDALYAEYDQLQDAIDVMSESSDDENNEREEFETQYHQLVAEARSLLGARPSCSTEAARDGSVSGFEDACAGGLKSNCVRLPKIDLPVFHGHYQHWLEFRDTFVSLIHSRSDMDNISKLHYLRASLKGSALLVIDNLDFKADNYEAAYKLLCDRYDNKRLLVNNHVRELFNVEHMRSESCFGIRRLIDVTNKNLRALSTLDQPTQYWDTLIIHMMAEKLDSVTHRVWEEHRNTLEMPPSLTTFITFLNNRADLLETLQESKGKTYKSESHKSNTNLLIATNNNNLNKSLNKFHKKSIACPICNQNHYLFACDTFRALPIESRIQKAKDSKVCLNCLRPGHLENKCNLVPCKYCKKRHNTLLHIHEPIVHSEPPMPSVSNFANSKNVQQYTTPAHILLSTALVKVVAGANDVRSARLLLDNGSTANFVTQSLCDASERAYGACLYVRSVDSSGSIQVHLLTSKSKIVPIKPTTTPRLELCGALLAARLCNKVLNSLTIPIITCKFWCDSTIVLGWLSTPPAHLKTFVRNRVNEIQESTESYTWSYVPSKDNPADLVSRGVKADQISSSSLWWSGPSFLTKDETEWPKMPNVKHDLPELIMCSFALDNHSNADPITNLMKNKSKLTHLQHIIAYLLRFIHNCRSKNNKLTGCLTVHELQNSLNLITHKAQLEMFPDEYAILKAGKSLPKKNRLTSLTPFLDSNNIMRVGGRLDNSPYSYDIKHPIILCSKHHFTKILFHHFHIKYLHAPPQLLLGTLKQIYWPLGGTNLAKHIVHKCIRCFRFKTETVQPIMGQLPTSRTNLEYPFLHCSVDYGGPVLIADRKGRGCKLIKSFLAIFICNSTKACHIELVTALSSDAFIAALKRFVSRRGVPSSITSDNGTNFVGASNELAQFLLNSDLQGHVAQEGIDFKFVPAYTPHFNGLAEAAVRSTKYHLKRILQTTHFTYEEMATCLTEIEAILNSRPLTPFATDPSDYTALTPSHFLIGRSLLAIPQPAVPDTNIVRLERYKRIQLIKQHFWNRFSTEYVSLLQQKVKWQKSNNELKLGSLVLIKDRNLPPLLWSLGRVIQLYPGSDGISRVAELRTRRGTIRRAFNNICPLPEF
ncbi:uncharacterized protein [Epargyreus clarus]|uniref:uncharacterized protein isoform X2 n=1 Tax=Epargyreus clarus TaxID=520877 RepID=UPI003C2D60BD